MIGRAVLVLAAVVYLATLGLVVSQNSGSSTADTSAAMAQSSTSTTTVHVSRESLPYRSVSILLQRVDWMDKYKVCIDEIAAVGADTVMFVVDARQENVNSIKVYLDMRMTPTPDQLADLVKYAKSKSLRVILMPVVLLDDPGLEWRGTIKPTSWEEWFDSYRAIMRHFAWIGQTSGVDLMVVGSELVSSETHVEEWKKTIAMIRQSFKGNLTYSSNWDHYTAVPFWDQLDLIGMNSYWKLGPAPKDNGGKIATVEQIKTSWKAIQKDLLPFIEKSGKPLILLEAGWCSMQNMAHEPWDYTIDEKDAPTDVEIQRRLYQGFFESWHGNPLLGGFNMWEWSNGDGGPEHRGYTPENKPAEKVLREWMAKPRWTVK